MNTNIRKELDSMRLSDIYSLMLYVLYKVQDIPEYATLSELCYLLDGDNLLRLLTYFSGKTIKIPTEKDFVILIDALLLYQYINIDHNSTADAYKKLGDISMKQQDAITELYTKLIPILNNYNINRSGMKSYE